LKPISDVEYLQKSSTRKGNMRSKALMASDRYNEERLV